MKAVVVDASVWVSRYSAQEVHHHDGCTWFERHFQSGGVVAAPAILSAEAGVRLRRQTGDRKLAHDTCRKLLRLPYLRMVSANRTLAVAAAKLAIDTGLRGADATYAALAQRLNIPLVTWDEQQRKRAPVVIRTLIPLVS